jgi:CRP/FNR family cyclic AMP-dependent transcriptional regulator
MPDVSRRELLAKIPLFSELEPRELDALAPLTHTKRLAARDTLFRKGDPGRNVFVIIRGEIKIFTTSADGSHVVFGIFGPGEVFGEIALLTGDERTATVTAIEEAELLTLDRRDFFDFLDRHPTLAVKLLGVLAGRVKRISELVEDTLFLNLPSRLARKLIHFGKSHGRETPDGVRIDLKLSQTEWGDLVGSTRESVNKQLRAWTEEGILSVNQGYVTIHRPEELDALSDLAW